MRLRAKEFDKMDYENRIQLISSRGIRVAERKLFHHQSIILFSLCNFFVEAIVNNLDNQILGMERLNLDEVSSSYCKDIPPFKF